MLDSAQPSLKWRSSNVRLLALLISLLSVAVAGWVVYITGRRALDFGTLLCRDPMLEVKKTPAQGGMRIRFLCICFLDRGHAAGWTGFNLLARTVWRTVRASRTIRRYAPRPRWKRQSLSCAVSIPLGVAESWKNACATSAMRGCPRPAPSPPSCNAINYWTPKSLPNIKPFCASSARPLMSSGRWTSKANSNCLRVVAIR